VRTITVARATAMVRPRPINWTRVLRATSRDRDNFAFGSVTSIGAAIQNVKLGRKLRARYGPGVRAARGRFEQKPSQ
jgi:hypothetical protein